MKSKGVAYLLWFFLGLWGIHRMYCGKWISGFIWLFTFGLFGIGWFLDFFLTLLYKRHQGGFGYGLPKLYKDNYDAKKVYASNEPDYILEPIITKNKPTTLTKNTATNSNVVTSNKTATTIEKKVSNTQAQKTKVVTPKDFANNTVLLNDMYYSTTKKDLAILISS